MKILITTELYKGTINGVVVSIKNLEENLIKMGHEVRILTVSDQGKSYKEGNAYYIKSIPTRIYSNIRVPIILKHRYIDQIIGWEPDVIHTQSEFFTLAYAKTIQKATGATIVHTAHTLYEQYADYFPMGDFIYKASFQPWLKHRLSCCDAIIAPSKKTLEILQSYEIDKEIHIVPTGIDLDKFRNTIPDEKIQAKRKDLGILNDEKVLIVLSRLGYEKNISELLFGISSLLKKEKLKFLIVGDGPAKKDLIRLASNLNITEKVIFTGMVDPSEVALYYQISDIFVSASTSETQGLTYIEALASGLPLVCKKDPCLDELMVEGENGYLYEKIDDLKIQIEKVLTELPGKNAKSIEISEKFSKENFAKEVYKIYSELL